MNAMPMLPWLKSSLALTRSLLFPEACVWCQADLSPRLIEKSGPGFKFEFEEDELHRLLCADCFLALKPYATRCIYCQKARPDFEACRKCQRANRVTRGVVALEYKDPLVQAVIHNFKYRFLKALAIPLGARLSEVMREVLLTAPARRTFVTAVPLSKRRQLWRGFNQAQLLADIVSAELSLPQIQVFKRIVHGPPLAKLPQEQRRQVIKNAFELKALPLKCERLIIIDDVWGTGATLGELVKLVSPKNSEIEIWAAVVAG